MTKASDLHRKWMRHSVYRKAHQALEPEFELAHAGLRRMARLSLRVTGAQRMKRESVPHPRKLAP